MSDLYRLRATRGWKDDEYIDQLRNSGVLIPVTIDLNEAIRVLVDRLHEGTAIGLISRHDMRLALAAAIGGSDEK